MNPGHPSQGSGSCEQRGWVRSGGTLPRTQPRSPRLSFAPGGPPGPSQTRPDPPFTSRTCSAPRTPRCLERRRLPSSAPSPFKNRRPALAPPPPRPQETCQRGDRSTGRREDQGSYVFRTPARHVPQRAVPTRAWAVGGGRHGTARSRAREPRRQRLSRPRETGAAPQEMGLLRGARQPSRGGSHSQARGRRPRLHARPQVFHCFRSCQTLSF